MRLVNKAQPNPMHVVLSQSPEQEPVEAPKVEPIPKEHELNAQNEYEEYDEEYEYEDYIDEQEAEQQALTPPMKPTEAPDFAMSQPPMTSKYLLLLLTNQLHRQENQRLRHLHHFLLILQMYLFHLKYLKQY